MPAPPSSSSSEPATLVADALAAAARSILVVTGAGVSHASGIATFRGSDPGAVWANSVMEKGTWAYFERDPVGSWSWYLERFRGLEDKLPNPAHNALVALERFQEARGGEFLLVTQNIDCLHEAAGSARIVKVHGSSDRVRCAADACVHGAPKGTLARADADLATFAARPARDTLPKCPACRDYLRPHVLWFDESYDEHADYQIATALRAAKHAEVVMFVGTSFAVGITGFVLDHALERGAKMISVDPAARAPHRKILQMKEPAETLLPAVVERLRAG